MRLVYVGCIEKRGSLAPIASRAILDNRIVIVIAAVRHLQRHKNVFFEKRFIGLAGHFLNYLPEQDVTVVVVIKLFAWWKIGGLVFEALDQLRQSQGQHCGLQINTGRVVFRQTRGVTEQVMDGYRLPARRTFRHILADRILQTQFAALLQKHDRYGSEHFGDRPNAKLCLRRVRHLEFQVGHSVTFAHEDLAVLRNQNRSAEPAGFDQGIHVLADFWRDVGARGARCLLWISLAAGASRCLSVQTKREVRESNRGEREQHKSLLQCKQAFHSSLRRTILVSGS